MPNPIVRPLGALLFVLSLCAPGVQAQNASSPDTADIPASDRIAADQIAADRIAAELMRLNSTLERLEMLMERQLEGKKVELTMKRVDFLSSRLEGVEAQLLKARDRRRSLEETQTTLEQERNQFAKQLENESLDDSDGQFRLFFEMMQQRVQDARRRAAEAEQEIAELESQRDTLQKEIVDWQDYIDRQISDL